MSQEYEWEQICEEHVKFEERHTYRMRIEGGSLYRYELNAVSSDNSRETCVTMVFVPERRVSSTGGKKLKARRSARR